MMRYTLNLFLGFFLLVGLCFTPNSVNGKEPIKEPSLGVNIVDSEMSAQAEASAQNANIGGRIPFRTTIRTNATFRTASCFSSNCVDIASAFSPSSISVGCPATATSNTCTIVLTFCGQFEADVESIDDDNLLVRFLIDGVRPNVGPTDADGFVSLMIPIDFQSETKCFRVTDTGNSVGPHNINVQFAVEDLSGDGAILGLGFAHLIIQVLRP